MNYGSIHNNDRDYDDFVNENDNENEEDVPSTRRKGDDFYTEFTNELESFSALLGRSFDSSYNDGSIIRPSKDHHYQKPNGKLNQLYIARNANIFIGTLGFVIALIIVIVISTNSIDISSPDIVELDNDIDFTMKRFNYEPLTYFASSSSSQSLTYSHLAWNYSGILEPYTKSIVHINHDNNYNDISYYTFSICSKSISSSPSSCTSGVVFINSDDNDVYATVQCKPYDVYYVKVTGYNDEDDVLSSGEGTVICQYVRREIREINSDDLNDVMDAMYKLWSTSDDEGGAMYGTNFHSHSYFAQLHDFNSAWRDADHIHEGVGFLMQNIKISNMFELAMQAVNPAVALPYWDYTIEGESNIKVQDSIIMSDDIFGNTSSPNTIALGFTYENDTIESGIITTGRWAYLTIDKMDSTLTYLKSGYGYLRAPWNMNPSPYVSRYALSSESDTNLPSCRSHYNILTEGNLMSFLNGIQYEPHSSVNENVGGVYGCDKFIPFVDKGYIGSLKSMYQLCTNWVLYLKEFYRNYNILPTIDCLVATNNLKNSQCSFDCVRETKLNLKSSLYNSIANYVTEDIANDANHEAWVEFYDFLCTGDGQKVFPGDSFQSSSPLDPIHWVIYPTLERLFHAKLLSIGFLNETWNNNSNEVCDKAECYSPFSPDYGYYSNCCDGHYSSSQLLDHTNWNRCEYFGDTNDELLKSLDPRRSDYSMGYIYNDFDWDHCQSSYDINELLSLAESTRLLSNIVSKNKDNDDVIPTSKPTKFADIPTATPTSVSSIDNSFC